MEKWASGCPPLRETASPIWTSTCAFRTTQTTKGFCFISSYADPCRSGARDFPPAVETLPAASNHHCPCFPTASPTGDVALLQGESIPPVAVGHWTLWWYIQTCGQKSHVSLVSAIPFLSSPAWQEFNSISYSSGWEDWLLISLLLLSAANATSFVLSHV